MSEKVDSIRNIALVAHGGAGKTSLAEALLFDAGVINRMGRIEEGNTAMDFEPEETKRTSSISTGFHQLTWKKHTISLMDTPGDQNFFSDTKTCLQAADAAVVVIDAVDGIKVQTEQGWEFLDEFELPRAIFINKLDRERADFQRTFTDVRGMFTPKPIILQLPIGAESGFKGIVDLIAQKAYLYGPDGKAKAADIPAEMKDEVAAERETLIENIAEADDALVERYLEGETLSEEDLRNALRKGTIARTFVPVLCGSATANIAIDLLMDFVLGSLPSPADRGPKMGKDPATGAEVERRPDPAAPFSALVVKTITDPYAGRLTIFRIFSGTIGTDGSFYNSKKETRERYSQLLVILGKEQKAAAGGGPGAIVAVAKLKETGTGDTLCDEANKVRFTPVEPIPTLISYALSAKNKGDEDKIFTSLTRLLEEDGSLRIDRLAETKEIILHGQGQIHIETTVERLKRKFNVEVQLNIPKVPYRETLKKKVRVQGRHKKQTGGHGQFGDCWVQFEPQPRGKGFEYVDAIVGGSIPRQYIPAVEKGI
ncbi:MAG: elongation factor G, partial [Desulfobacteraceae bacterium]